MKGGCVGRVKLQSRVEADGGGPSLLYPLMQGLLVAAYDGETSLKTKFTITKARHASTPPPAMLVASLYRRHVPETRQPNAHGVSADSVSSSKLFDY